MRIFYTADVIQPDGSDTWVYGDPCDEGMGATLVSGWVSASEAGNCDPSVYDDRSDDSDWFADVWTAEDGPMVDWAVSTILRRIGIVEESNSAPTFYACEATDHPYSGVSASYAAHIHGASDGVVSAVAYALARSSRYPFPDYAESRY